MFIRQEAAYSLNITVLGIVLSTYFQKRACYAEYSREVYRGVAIGGCCTLKHLAFWQICSTSIMLVNVVLRIKREGVFFVRKLAKGRAAIF